MKIQISATSNWDFDKTTIIEVNSIDEAIKRIQEDRYLVSYVIDDSSWLYDKHSKTVLVPNKFIINTNKTEEYDVEIELYDYYIE